MTTQRQEPRPDSPHTRRQPPWARWLIASTILLFVAVGTIIWILTSRNAFIAILPIVIFTVLGVLIALFQWLFPVSSSPSAHLHASQVPQHSPIDHQPQPIIMQASTTLPLPPPSSLTYTASYRGIVGLPPPTDPRTIEQREHVVREVYTKLIRPEITAVALTGIGGVGKSTLAALIYRYTEEQRRVLNSQFLANTLWLTVDPAVTFADLVGNLFQALGKILPDLSTLGPQNQAVALFNALNTTSEPRLIILDQFENLLDWETGHALNDRPGVGEWLDIINSQQCSCHILLTSHLRPVGTREYPPTYLQKYTVRGLDLSEGIKLLRNRGVQGTEAELKTAVTRCAGHAFSLTLLASLAYEHHLNLTLLLKNTSLWIGDIATNLLDQIYMERLSEAQQVLMLAFSVYREPMPLEATLAIVRPLPKGQAASALRALLIQHLLEPMSGGLYQLHAIIIDFAQGHFEESSEQANEEALQAAHAKAAQYYLERAAITCPPREKRRQVGDVHDLVEAIWQFCQAEEWQEAYEIMEEQEIVSTLKLWGGYVILLELSQLLLSSDKWKSERAKAIRFYNDLSELYRVLGRIDQAMELCNQALSFSKDIGDRKGEAKALNNLANIYVDLGYQEQAYQYYQKALEMYGELGERRWEGNALNGLAWICRSFGQREEALNYYLRALSIRREVGHRSGEAETLSGVGLLTADLGKNDEALDYYEQALQIRREIGDRGGEGRTLNGLGLVYSALGEVTKAYGYYKSSLEIRREIGDRGGEGISLFNIGKLYFKQNRYEAALASFVLAKNIFNEIQNSNYHSTLKWIDLLHEKMGDEQFSALLVTVEPQAQQIVDQALLNGLQ